MISLGKIEKMWIQALTDPADDSSVTGERYDFMINPESFTLRYELEYVEQSAAGSAGAQQTYARNKANVWDFDIIIDGTGVIKDASALSISLIGFTSPPDVQVEVEKLKTIAVSYNSETHRSNYLKLTWGDRIFKGTLNSLDLNYKLFKPDGKPLRVIAKLKLTEWLDPTLQLLYNAPSSPDITHQRTFKPDDKFDLLTKKIYNDPKYYLGVAKSNKLNSFRRIPTGTIINFPPIK
ncbi:MAG: hypothetical protein ACHQFW_02995 [Chitinophagales bacterium]